MLLLTLFVVVVSLCYWLYRATRHDYWIKRRVPSASDPHWLFGHFKELFTRTKYFGDVFQDIYNSYPAAPYVGYLRFFSPGLMIRDPDLIKTLMTTDQSSFSKNELEVDKEHDFLFGYNPFVLTGEEWKSSRGHATPFSTSVKLKNFLPAMRNMGRRLVRHIKESCEKNDNNIAVFETKELGMKYTTDVVSNAVLGVENDSFANADSLFGTITKNLFTDNLIDQIKLMVSFLIPSFAKKIGFRFSPKKTEDILLKVTREMMARAPENEGNDLFQQMKIYREKDKSAAITDKYIASHSFAFLLDGTETSSNLFCFALFELAWNSDIQDKLRSEIMDILSNTEGECSLDDIENAKYLHMVLLETLRRHPPFGILSKVCTSRYLMPAIDGEKPWMIEEGTPIAISLQGLQMDPKYFPNPTKFDPERFSEEEVAKRHKFVFLPFGEGPRRCVGQRFALLQSKLAVFELLSNFRLKPSSKSNYPLEIDPATFIGRPLNGAWINFEPIQTQ